MSGVPQFYWALAWTIVASVGFIGTAWINRWLAHASVRHLGWLIAFCSAALLPFWHLPAAFLRGKDTSVCLGTPGVDGLNSTLAWTLIGIWGAGVLWNLGRAFAGWRQVRQWRDKSVSYTPPAEIPREVFGHIDLRIARSAQPPVAITFGRGKPVLLLPQSAREWDSSRLCAVLWHEVGHIRRFDNTIQLFALLVCSMHWFNPFFWFAFRRLEGEAELAADDFAILRGVKPSSYGSELLAIRNELSSGSWRCSAGQTAMLKTVTLEHRLRSIIAPNSQRGGATIMTSIPSSLLVAGLAALLTISAPFLVSRLAPHPPECRAPAYPSSTNH